jgi:hypothetical protein
MGRELSILLPRHTPGAKGVTAHCYAQNPPNSTHDGVYRARMEEGVEAFRDINHISDDEASGMRNSLNSAMWGELETDPGTIALQQT